MNAEVWNKWLEESAQNHLYHRGALCESRKERVVTERQIIAALCAVGRPLILEHFAPDSRI